jgi:hypothetical protein
VVPGWVTTELQLERWVEQVISSSGATAEPDPVTGASVIGVDLDGTEFILMDFAPVRLDFGPGMRQLDARMLWRVDMGPNHIAQSIEQLEYNFHVSGPDSPCIVRYDRHGHQPDWEPVDHVHRGAEETRAPYHEVYLDDVVNEIRLELGWDQILGEDL